VDLDFDLVGEDSGADSQENERGVRPTREIYYGGRISCGTHEISAEKTRRRSPPGLLEEVRTASKVSSWMT